MHKCLSGKRLSQLNVKTEPTIYWCGKGDPCTNVSVQKRSTCLNVETEPRFSVYPMSNLCIVLHFLIFHPRVSNKLTMKNKLNFSHSVRKPNKDGSIQVKLPIISII